MTREIQFQTRNDIPAITDEMLTTYAELTGKDHLSKDTRKTNKGWFNVDECGLRSEICKGPQTRRRVVRRENIKVLST